MFGTVARLRVKPGRVDDLVAVMEEWDRDVKPNAPGAVAGYAYQLESDPNVVYMTAVFSDRQAYFANADNPEQNEWYERFRELLEEDPEWNDGEIVYHG